MLAKTKKKKKTATNTDCMLLIYITEKEEISSTADSEIKNLSMLC